MKKLVNAGLKSKKELAQRMIDGEVFIHETGARLYYSEQSPLGKSPFLVKHSDGDIEEIEGLWSYCSEMLVEVEVEWYDYLEETGPRLCWVGDTEETLKRGSKVRLVKMFCENTYIDTSNVPWEYAIPLTKEELLKFSGDTLK